MRNSFGSRQQTVLCILDKNRFDGIKEEVFSKNHQGITQINIINCSFLTQNGKVFSLLLPDNIERLLIRKCSFSKFCQLQIEGNGLTSVEINSNCLTICPIIKSAQLSRVDLKHNLLERISMADIESSVHLLDLKDNHISSISASMLFKKDFTIIHQFLTPNVLTAITQQYSKNASLIHHSLVDIQVFFKNNIFQMQTHQIIEICDQAIQNDNYFILETILTYFTKDFQSKIFDIAKKQRKYQILDAMLKSFEKETITMADRLMILNPCLFAKEILKKLSIKEVVECLSCSKNSYVRVLNFLNYLSEISTQHENQNLLIKSEEDLLQYINLNSQINNHYEVNFLLSQKVFFQTYNFQNKSILIYLIKFDSIELIQYLKCIECFTLALFCGRIYKKYLKPMSRTYRMLIQCEKAYLEGQMRRKQRYYPQYKEMKQICLRKDVYDYQSLQQYEQMQASFHKKDLALTIKFCNPDNCYSIAKRIKATVNRNNLSFSINRSNLSFSIHSKHKSPSIHQF